MTTQAHSRCPGSMSLAQRAMGHRQVATTVVCAHVADEDLVEATEWLR